MNEQSWQDKIKKGRYVERQVLRWIKKTYDKDAFIPGGYLPEYDIDSKAMGNIEVKEDRIAHHTDNYAIEFVNGNGKPSGIEITTAKFFVIVDYEYLILIPTESLKFVLNNCQNKKIIDMGDRFPNGNCSRGWLIPRNVLLTTPFAQVTKRWFPVFKEKYGR